MKVLGLFQGRKQSIGPHLSPSGIFKTPREEVEVDHLGIKGDIQVDKRFHGGPERALHQFSLASYEKIIKRFPLLHKHAKPGQIGENISASLMSESSVCIGDIYQVGETRIQVSSPRMPCWKIDAKLKQPGLSQYILQQQLCGWYFSVIQNGKIKLGDEFSLLERPNPQLSIQQFIILTQNKPLDSGTRLLVENARGLDPDWLKKLLK